MVHIKKKKKTERERELANAYTKIKNLYAIYRKTEGLHSHFFFFFYLFHVKEKGLLCSFL